MFQAFIKPRAVFFKELEIRLKSFILKFITLIISFILTYLGVCLLSVIKLFNFSVAVVFEQHHLVVYLIDIINVMAIFSHSSLFLSNIEFISNLHEIPQFLSNFTFIHTLSSLD